jgi:hypothetical protein
LNEDEIEIREEIWNKNIVSAEFWDSNYDWNDD